jgi:hypothetical protein
VDGGAPGVPGCRVAREGCQLNGVDMNAVSICTVCRFFWCVLVMGSCTYVVFWMGQSGWWFALAVLLCTGNCKAYRTPEQINASANLERAKNGE